MRATPHAILIAILAALLAPAFARAEGGAPAPAEVAPPQPAPERTVSPALTPLADRLADLEGEERDAAARAAGVDALLSDVRTRLVRVEALDTEVREKAAEGASGLQIGAALRRAKAGLPNPADLRASSRASSREATRLDDRLFELQESRGRIPVERDRLRAFLRDNLALPDPDEATLGEALGLSLRLDAMAAALADTLGGDTGLIARLQELAAQQAALGARSDALSKFINERVFWVRSDPPIGRAQARSLARFGQTLADPDRWFALLKALVLVGWVGVTGPMLGAVVGLALARFWAGRRLRFVLLHAATPGRESAWHAVEGLALAALRAAFFPGLLWAASRVVSGLASEGAGRLATAIGAGLAQAAGAVFAGAFLISLASRGGVGEALLHWRPASAAAARRSLAWFVPLFGSLLGVLGFGNALAEDAETRVLARLAFVALMLSVGVFLALAARPGGRMARAALADGRRIAGRKALAVIHALTVLAFAALAVMALMGWYFTAEVLAARIRDTAIVVAAALIVRALAMRAVNIAIERAGRRHIERMAPGAQGAPADLAPDERAPAPDLSLVRRQVGSLLGIVVTIGALAALGPIWNDVFPALNRLDSIGLIPFGDVNAEALRIKGEYVLTLRDALKTAVILGVGFFALRTLPAMLDGLVLSRTSLDPGARYAALTIAKYAFLGVTIFLALGALRTKWGSVGWVLGGLSVGIGLGLQQFIGNLVAGLSLLFERTIRPGDRVQVGEHLGVVKEITIRATTLADFRRRDVIVPNSQMLSGVVINETRSDRAGVVSFEVGVAYGSDTALVQRVILEACRAHPDVIDASANFDRFGDNSLVFKAWIGVREVDRRPVVANDIQLAIDAAFRREGVEMSFPQRDLHLRGGEVVVRLADGRAAQPRPAGAE